MCFMYRRACDDMLMLHDPKDCRPWGTPEYQFYEFNDRKIMTVMGSNRIPRHLTERGPTGWNVFKKLINTSPFRTR